MMPKLTLSYADREAMREMEARLERRRNRFRILVCIDGSDEAYNGLRFAADIGHGDDCDIILLYVRPVDQGLRSGGLQVRVARTNMLEWGLELPGIRHLKKGLQILKDEGLLAQKWKPETEHTDAFGDPLGDNKVVYRLESGKCIVLKLKTAPDPVSGILDQYELGPYNLIIIGTPSTWKGEMQSFWRAGSAQKVASLAPCSVLVSRPERGDKGFLIAIDGSPGSMDELQRAAVLAHHCGEPISVITVAPDKSKLDDANETLAEAMATLEQMGIPKATKVIRVGDPVSEIVDESKDYSLVVVSDSRKSHIRRLFFKNPAFEVMGRSKISVLNVR